MRESALGLASDQLNRARNGVVAEKARLEEKSGLLKNLTSRAKQERELRTVQSNLAHYDSQLKKAESLAALIQKDIARWLECSLKTGAPEYAAALATHDYPADWARLSYGFELLVKSFRMGLQDLPAIFRRENVNGARSPLLMDSIRKLLPIARQIEIDAEFFNRILVQREKQKRIAEGKAAVHPEYNWCEAIDQLGVLRLDAAQETLQELLTGSAGFLGSLSQAIKREQFLVDTKAAQSGKADGRGQSFLQLKQEELRSVSRQWVNIEKLGTIITETESLLMDGEFTARFNRYLVQSIPPAQPPVTAPARLAASRTTPAIPQSDDELRALKAKLQAELDEVARTKAGLATRERALRDNEQKLRTQEQTFTADCLREQAAMEAAKAKVAEMEAAILLKDREAEESRAEQLARLEEMKAEADARAQFLEESEQRLLNKGQEQLEILAELEQKEEDLMATKRELNAMRKEIGIPMVALRSQPVDEFSE